MKIAEKLSEIKQKEGKLMRLYSLRDSIVKKQFKDDIMGVSDMKPSEYQKKRKEFLVRKRQKVDELNEEIDRIRDQLMTDKNKVNRKNVELGIDKKLVRMKYLRIELSKLMKLVQEDSFLSRSSRIDIDVYEELGIADRLKELEAEKSKLDSSIQQLNWSEDL